MEMATNATYPEGAGNSSATRPHPTQEAGYITGMTIAYVFIFISGLFGNAVIIYIVATRKGMKSTFNFLIVNMAIGDLLVCLFIVPLEVKFLYLTLDWFGGGLGSVTCKFFNFSGVLSIAATIITLVFITLDRYFAVLHPFIHLPIIRNTKVVTSVIWITSSLYFALYLVLFDAIPDERGVWKCRMVWSYLSLDEVKQFEIARGYITSMAVVLYAIPLVLIAGLYTLIGRHLWSREIPGHSTANHKRNAELAKRKVLRMLIIVVVTFALCWLPAHFMNVMKFFFKDQFLSLPFYVETSFYFVSHANSAINPYLYILLNQRFNNEFKIIVKCIFCRAYDDDLTLHSIYHSVADQGTMQTRREDTA